MAKAQRWLAVSAFVCALVLSQTSGANAACRQALVFALDVSGSVDDQEYALQLQGLAAALDSSDVRDVLFQSPETPVYVTVFEWSGNAYQRLIIDWTALSDEATLNNVTLRLRGWQRQSAPQTTSLGGAINKSIDLLARAPNCWKRTIDISGDGMNNDWPQPQALHGSPALSGVTINALVIGIDILNRMDHEDSDIAELTAYFKSQVIHGPGAFIEVALGFNDYAAAMTRKLLRELQSFAIGGAHPNTQPPAPMLPG